MKVFSLLILFFSMKAMANLTLLDCAPSAGQLSEDKHEYFTYSLETKDLEAMDWHFRKGLLLEENHFYLEKETYKPAFVLRQDEKSFALGYQFEEDKILILGMIWPESSGDEVMASAVIMADFADSKEPLKSLMEPPAHIKEWQCLVDMKKLKELTAGNEFPPQMLLKLHKHFGSPSRVTSRGN